MILLSLFRLFRISLFRKAQKVIKPGWVRFSVHTPEFFIGGASALKNLAELWVGVVPVIDDGHEILRQQAVESPRLRFSGTDSEACATGFVTAG
jgi:hypothetical protein